MEEDESIGNAWEEEEEEESRRRKTNLWEMDGGGGGRRTYGKCMEEDESMGN